MSTRANVVIKYQDRNIGAPSELWLYHHQDGNVQGIGEEIVQTVHDCGLYIENGDSLGHLWDRFSREYEDVTGMQEDIGFLYRVTYADNKVTVVVRHGGYAIEPAEWRYNRASDTAHNSVELLRTVFKDGTVTSLRHDIREPETYIRTLMDVARPGARTWRGHLLQPRKKDA
jgi:hypothetical protein